MKKTITTFAFAAAVLSGNTFADEAKPKVPMLNVEWACGQCQAGDAVKEALLAGYAEAAKEAGAELDTGSPATLKVDDYSERTGAARMLLGVFAGKDMIRGEVSYQGKSFLVEDSARSTVFGIETVARNVGKDSLKGLVPGTVETAPAVTKPKENSGNEE